MFNYRMTQVLSNELQSTEAYHAYKNDRKDDHLSFVETHLIDRESNWMPYNYDEDDD